MKKLLLLSQKSKVVSRKSKKLSNQSLVQVFRRHFIFDLTLPIIFAFTLISAFANAQTADIRGFVYDKQTGEPVIFTSVYLQGTVFGISTDVNGYYSISRIPPGSYKLMVSYLGYDTLSVPVELKAGDIITKKLYLAKSGISLKAVEISAEKSEAKTEVRMSVTKITPKEIKQIPSVGGDPDIAQYLQVIPGVVSTGDQGGQLYIRGGSPIQNKVLLDGMVIYNPFHSIGLFSVFDADIIRNADVYTGGFGARYGGRISSVMDITTRDGNKKRIAGKVGATPFGAKALVEGPLLKQKDENSGSSSFILSGKGSYLDKTSKVLYKYANENGLPFNFMDLYGKTSFNAANGSKLNLFGYNFRDRVNYPAPTDLNWKSWGLGSNFILIPTGTNVLIDGAFSYSNYKSILVEDTATPRNSGINGFNMGLNFTYFIKKHEVKYGIEAYGFTTDFNYFNAVGKEILQKENTTELAGYVSTRFTWDRLIIDPSFRAHYYASLANFSPEPRLGIKINATDKFRIKGAGGLYSQNLISANSDRDVVNLFTGFISGPSDLQENFQGDPITHKLQKAIHVIAGFEYDLTSYLNINIEGYRKYFTQLTNINRNKIYSSNTVGVEDYYKKDFIVERGMAEGIDFLLKLDYKRFYFWTGYSIAYVERKDEKVTYNPHYDRRHNINVVTSYTFGKDLNWEFDFRWNFGSGFPFTQTQGFYPNVLFTDINANYTQNNAELGIEYAGLNQGRLSDYHRLDLTLKRKFELTEHSTLETNISVTNAYNRDNIFYFDRIRHERVDQLPILPAAGLSLSF